MSNGDYFLGTQDDEVQRLAIQHRVWRDEMLSGFRNAGFGTGQTILDVGAGPGHASADISELVGSSGEVVAIERSPHFATVLRSLGRSNLTVRELDLMNEDFGDLIADGAWIRWVLAFLPDPALAVDRIARALRPGGTAVFQEYLDYAAWRLIPQPAAHRQYRDLVVQSWRESGGEPDAALDLPSWLDGAGMEMRSIRPMVRIIGPEDPMWEWPASFMATNAWRLHDLGYCSVEDAETFSTLLDDPDPSLRMLTPVVAEVIAVKR